MHIVMIGSRYSIHVVRWANELLKEGFKITVFSMHQEREEFDADINFIRLPFRNPAGYVLNIPFLKAKIQDIKPDIVHSFYAFGHGFLGRNCSGQIPHVISVLGSDIFDDVHKNRIYRAIIVRNILQANVVCSTSNVMAKQIEEICEQSMDIKITPFGVDTSLFNPHNFEMTSTKTFTIGTVKWLEIKYGVDVLIKAFAGLCRLYPEDELKLVIVGSGTQEGVLKKLAEELSIRHKCDFMGAVPHEKVPEILDSFDVYVALSRLDSESFGVAVLEASSMEIPVIVSNVGGLPEVVINGSTGIVVESENINETIEAFEQLYLSSKLRRKLGHEGRRHVKEKYSWDSSLEKMIEVYSTIIQKTRVIK